MFDRVLRPRAGHSIRLPRVQTLSLQLFSVGVLCVLCSLCSRSVVSSHSRLSTLLFFALPVFSFRRTVVSSQHPDAAVGSVVVRSVSFWWNLADSFLDFGNDSESSDVTVF